MSVKIRMKSMGRKHRRYFRIVAMDTRTSRDGRALEELGTYDPSVKETDNRVTLKPSRIKHWLGNGAKPSEKVAVLLSKYMEKWEKIEADEAAGITPAEESGSEEAPAEEATDESTEQS